MLYPRVLRYAFALPADLVSAEVLRMLYLRFLRHAFALPADLVSAGALPLCFKTRFALPADLVSAGVSAEALGSLYLRDLI